MFTNFNNFNISSGLSPTQTFRLSTRPSSLVLVQPSPTCRFSSYRERVCVCVFVCVRVGVSNNTHGSFWHVLLESTNQVTAFASDTHTHKHFVPTSFSCFSLQTNLQQQNHVHRITSIRRPEPFDQTVSSSSIYSHTRTHTHTHLPKKVFSSFSSLFAGNSTTTKSPSWPTAHSPSSPASILCEIYSILLGFFFFRAQSHFHSTTAPSQETQDPSILAAYFQMDRGLKKIPLFFFFFFFPHSEFYTFFFTLFISSHLQ